MTTKHTPTDNCLKCKYYEKCAKYESGKCYKAEKRKKKITKNRNKVYTIDGLSMTRKDWADYLGVSRDKLWYWVDKEGIGYLKKLKDEKGL